MDRDLKLFIENVQSDVQAMVYAEGDGVSFEDKFTEYCIEIVEGLGETEGAIVCAYNYPGDQGKDWKVNGYCLRDSYKEDKKTLYETLDLFVTHYQCEYFYNITKDVLNKCINQLKRFLNGALKGYIDYVDPAHELFQLIKIIGNQSREFDRINIFFFSNGSSNHYIDKVSLKGFEDLGIYVHIWDIERLYRLSQSTSSREPLEIDFTELMPDGIPGIPCLKIPDLNELYECYLAIIPGSVLSSLYKEHSSKLLESNVRAFLGQAGKYNRAIRDTIREKPQMFLPYNNGLSATADLVETVTFNNQLYIKSLNDFQIVNGGQTTASIYHTQKKYKDADLSKIFVQMKLTVIKDTEQKNVEVPNIARFANSQNKVTDLDLSSNNIFFVRLEELSRRKYVINPENRGQQILWYFERVNGQYKVSLNKLTPSQQKMFKEKSPASLKFVKSDVAKLINLWEQEPHQVSAGSQKNFNHFMKKVADIVAKGKLPGEFFYKKLIGNAILYRVVDKLFGRKNIDAIGDTNIKSFTVAYTVSFFHFLTDNRLDLWKIYEHQKIEGKIVDVLKELLVFVYEFLIKGANNTLLSEYAKKDTTWQSLKNVKYSLASSMFSDYLITKSEANGRENEKEIDSSEVENELFSVSKITTLGLKFWDGLRIHIERTGKLKELEFDVWDLFKSIQTQRNIDRKAIKAGKRVLELIETAEIDIESIKALSSIADDNFIDLKAIYDRMKLLSKDEWASVIALSTQTKLFDNLELANVKSIQRSIINNENIKPASLVKAHESLKKLKRYGIKY